MIAASRRSVFENIRWRRKWSWSCVKFGMVAAVMMVFCCQCRQRQESVKIRRPNVLFILVDDLGISDLSCTGSDFYETPNIDRLAGQSFVFTQGYAASRVCSPSRASIFTGKYTATHGITDWIGAAAGEQWRSNKRYDKLLPADYVRNLPLADITLAEVLRDSGYKTFFAGKWHLGGEGSYPEDHGFDINKGGWEVGSPMGGYFSPWTNPKLDNRNPGENLSMRLAEETTEFIRAHRDSSFFAFLSFYAVHGPIQTSEAKWRKYRDKAESLGIKNTGYVMERNLPIRTQQDNPIYGGLVENMDDAVGLVLRTLKELGLEENTLVIFTSDNGGVASGDSFSTSNLPLRGGKGYQWEGGIREPYFIKVPWIDQPHRNISDPVTGADFYPTILDMLKIETPPSQQVEGISLKPVLEGKTLPERPLYWHYPHYGNQGGDPSSIVRVGKWKLIHYWEDQHEELYNLEADPGEQQDVSTEHLDIQKRLGDQLKAWLQVRHARLPVADEKFTPDSAQARHESIVANRLPQLELQRREMLSPDFSPNADWWGSKVSKD